MRNILSRDYGIELTGRTRQQFMDSLFPTRHRVRKEDFTRASTLTFPVLMLFILRKSVKSLQNRLHEFVVALREEAQASLVSSSAVTHARAKLKGSAFVELNDYAVLDLFYSPKYEPLVELWHGQRLLGVDGSKVRLPQSEELREKFGTVPAGNQHGMAEEYPEGRMSVLYDLLNRVGIEGCLVSSKIGEVDLAIGHLKRTRRGDIVIADRGYSGYLWFAEVQRHGAEFVCRCQENSFAVVDKLFKRDEAGVSIEVGLRAQKNLVSELRRKGLPVVMKVRFVTVRLSTGELEVLATSLLDEKVYPTKEFGELYWKRWGHETYYGDLKGALDLENFSGKTVEAVEQDFQALVFLANVQSALVKPAEEKLEKRSASLKNPLKVNRSVALNAVRNRAIDLLASDKPIPEVVDQLTQWFMAEPVSVRTGRKVPRRKPSMNRSYNYQRRVRKFVF